MTSIVSAAVSPSLSASLDAPALPGVLQDPVARRAVRLAWKAYVRRLAESARAKPGTPSGPSARDLVVYCLLLGRPLHRAFTPVTNPVKLANGQRPYEGLMHALASVDHFIHDQDLYGLLRVLDAPFETIPGKALSGGGQVLPRHVCPAHPLVKAAAQAVREADVLAAYSALA